MSHVDTGMFPQITLAPHVLSDLGPVGCCVACAYVLRLVEEKVSIPPPCGHRELSHVPLAAIQEIGHRVLSGYVGFRV